MPEKDILRGVLEQAILAPSSHNTQPWLFEVGDDGIRLFADRGRALPVNDPDDRELTISCGCALLNLRAAAAAAGLGLRVVCFPDPANRDLLAEVRFAGEADEALSSLARAIPRRRTCRKAFDQREVEEDLIDKLRRAAEAEGAWIDPLYDEGRRAAAAKLIAQGDARLWANARWRRELSAWLRARSRGDGLVLPWLGVAVARSVVRIFDMGKKLGASNQALAEASPFLIVLGTDTDTAGDWLAGGQALERLLLVAADAGVQASYLNQPIQVPDLRSGLQDLCHGDGFPQMLFRLGYPTAGVPASPRRDLDDVIRKA